MKKLTRYFSVQSIIIILFINLLGYASICLAQSEANLEFRDNNPPLVKPSSHDPKFTNFPEKSFYQSRDDWQAIIDSTWGSGLPLADKLQIFDQYTSALNDKFCCFPSLEMSWEDWDTLRANLRAKIDSSTSRGRFHAIMRNLTRELREGHTQAIDSLIFYQTPLNPGIPLLVFSLSSVEHFGAVVTILPDTSVMVLRTTPDHPLGLQPGDIILGYENVPYPLLLEELLAAELPAIGFWGGAESAYTDGVFSGAGMNWHLFETIDILQYSTGDTLHLSLEPMINLDIPQMLNNEQIEIPNIPFPDYFNDQLVSYGILDNSNIGYIYLFSEWPSDSANQQFYEAVNALKNTNGLIIDMRWNLGGWAFFDDAFDLLFNESIVTFNGAYREYLGSFDLTPYGPWFSNYTRVDANPDTFYDRPIAVLLGPSCVSLGEWTAHRLSYHPRVKFFGKSSAGILSGNGAIKHFPDWDLRYSIDDFYHFNQPGNYLNLKEFPIDYPVWHNADDAAKGIDAVVEAAKSWIITGIEDESLINYPIIFSLSQNYPNPFNPTTTISYQLPKTSNVELSIYNLIGQKVATLINKKQRAGTYNVLWDARSFASGIYLYRIESGDFIKTKKLVLLK